MFFSFKKTDGEPVVVGTYFPDSDKTVFGGAKVLWQGTSCRV